MSHYNILAHVRIGNMIVNPYCNPHGPQGGRWIVDDYDGETFTLTSVDWKEQRRIEVDKMDIYREWQFAV